MKYFIKKLEFTLRVLMIGYNAKVVFRVFRAWVRTLVVFCLIRGRDFAVARV